MRHIIVTPFFVLVSNLKSKNPFIAPCCNYGGLEMKLITISRQQDAANNFSCIDDGFPVFSGRNFLILPPSRAKTRSPILEEQQPVHKLITRDAHRRLCLNFVVMKEKLVVERKSSDLLAQGKKLKRKEQLESVT